MSDHCLNPATCDYASRGWCPICEPVKQAAKVHSLVADGVIDLAAGQRMIEALESQR